MKDWKNLHVLILSRALIGEYKEQTKERNDASDNQHENGKKYRLNYSSTINFSLPTCHALRQAKEIYMKGNYNYIHEKDFIMNRMGDPHYNEW